MRKVLYTLAGVVAFVVIVAGISLFLLFRNSAATDAEIGAYVKNAVVAIATDWSTDELMHWSTLDFRHHTEVGDLQGLFDAARAALGPLIVYEGAKGGWTAFTPARAGMTMSARYAAHAKFQKGEAELELALQKIDGKWEIEGFRINSSTLMRYMIGRKT